LDSEGPRVEAEETGESLNAVALHPFRHLSATRAAWMPAHASGKFGDARKAGEEHAPEEGKADPDAVEEVASEPEPDPEAEKHEGREALQTPAARIETPTATKEKRPCKT
jgi:hypothetical protein